MAHEDGNGRHLTFEWIARGFTFAAIAVLGWIATDALNTLNRIEERVRMMEIKMAERYVTRKEMKELVGGLERRLNNRLSRELPQSPRR